MAHISQRPRTSRPRDARVERTHHALRSALLRLLEEKSFDQITIRDICASAGTGYATYFRHHPDKQALLNDLAAVAISELLERALPILYAVDTRAACVALCSYVDERRQLWSTLLTGGAAGNLREEFVRQGRLIAAADAQRSQRDTKAPAWLPPDLAVVLGVSGVIEILTFWLQHRRRFTLDEIAGILDRLVIAPLVQTEPPATRARPKPRQTRRKR